MIERPGTPTGEGDREREHEERPTLLFRCVACGNYHPGRRTADGTLEPSTGGQGNRGRDCGAREFDRVTLATDATSGES